MIAIEMDHIPGAYADVARHEHKSVSVVVTSSLASSRILF